MAELTARLSPIHVEPVPTNAESVAPLLVDERTAARLLGVSPRTIWAMANRGDLPRVRIGKRCVRFRVADLQAWCEQQVQAGKPPAQ